MIPSNFVFNLYAIKDRLNGYGMISIDANDETAIRNFAYAMQSGISSFAASDYELYKIGTYNINSAEVTSCPPVFVLDGITAKDMYK